MRVFLYVLGAWHDPDTCEQGIPWTIDDSEIFFGPCKRHLRALLRADYLKDQQHCDLSGHDVFLVGLNAANDERERKIIWVGKATTLMTFAHAWRSLVAERYEEMREDAWSPLHLEPLFEGERHIGYRHASLQHADQWLNDLTGKRSRLARSCTVTDSEVRVLAGYSPTTLFERDACLLLERRFVATGRGIDLSKAILDTLRDANFLRDGDTLDAYAPFGHRSDESADGKTGSWVELPSGVAERFMKLVEHGATGRAPQQPARRSTHACDC
jgi:hypothetical protein